MHEQSNFVFLDLRLRVEAGTGRICCLLKQVAARIPYLLTIGVNVISITITISIIAITINNSNTITITITIIMTVTIITIISIVVIVVVNGVRCRELG